MSRRSVVVSLLALVSGSGVAQMMGGPMSTTQYFPLVDGARMGNDGGVTITFTSPTTGTMQLPGGRVTAIQPDAS